MHWLHLLAVQGTLKSLLQHHSSKASILRRSAFKETARRSNQSILKEINHEYSLEGLMLKLQYFGQLMQRDGSLENTLMLGKVEGKRRRGQQRMRWLDGLSDSMDYEFEETPGVSEGQGSLACCH